MTNQQQDLSSPTLVLGATGKTGRRVAERLRERGIAVRPGSRSATPSFDWERPDTWRGALEGVEAAYVSFYPDLAMPGTADTIAAFARLSGDLGVRRLVLLSGRGEPEAQRAEQAMSAGGTEWTVVRASWFSQNFSEGHLLEPVLGGEVALPAADVGEPFVDIDDIADVAVAALTEDHHHGHVYEVTGPRSVTFAEAVEEIQSASGRPVAFRSVQPEGYRDMLISYGVPSQEAEMLTELFAEVLDGRNAVPADGVEEALGRKPRDFADFVRATAATGIWSRT